MLKDPIPSRQNMNEICQRYKKQKPLAGIALILIIVFVLVVILAIAIATCILEYNYFANVEKKLAIETLMDMRKAKL